MHCDVAKMCASDTLAGLPVGIYTMLRRSGERAKLEHLPSLPQYKVQFEAELKILPRRSISVSVTIITPGNNIEIGGYRMDYKIDSDHASPNLSERSLKISFGRPKHMP